MKIAIVKLSALGDIVHAMVALQFIKQAYPECRIDWLVESGFSAVLEDNPHIDQILPIDLKALKRNKRLFFQQLSLLRQYADKHYDCVIDAQGLLKSAICARLLASQTAGFDRDSIREKAASLFYRNRIAYPYDANTIDRNVAVIGLPLEVEITPQQIREKKPFLYYSEEDADLQNFFSSDKPNVVFVIGSTWPSRNYPKQKYLKVIETLDANSLISWGNEQEKQSADWIAERCAKAKVLKKIDLKQLKFVLAKADLVIGNDTGPTHMAWGLNRPSITLFGPTPVSRVYQTTINKVLKSPSTVNPFKLNKNDFSINEIPEQSIIDLALTLLTRNAANG